MVNPILNGGIDFYFYFTFDQFWIPEKGIQELHSTIGENLQQMIEKRMEKEEVGEALEPVHLVVVGMHQQQVGLEDHLKVFVFNLKNAIRVK